MKIYKDLDQGTDEWLEVRKWVITWTKLKWITGWAKAQLTQMYELLAEKYIVEEPLNSYEIIERWHELEPIAKAKYEHISWNRVEEVGFITCNDWHGLSPDWIILDEDSWLYKKAIEIKCPRGKNYIKYLLEDKIPDEYKQQVFNYFIVMDDLEELDFIIYNPDVTEDIKDIHIITVTRDQLQSGILKSIEKVDQFKKEWDIMDNILKTK